MNLHCDKCGTPWFSTDGMCALCRSGYCCRCDEPGKHKFGEAPAGCLFAAWCIFCVLVVVAIFWALVHWGTIHV